MTEKGPGIVIVVVEPPQQADRTRLWIDTTDEGRDLSAREARRGELQVGEAGEEPGEIAGDPPGAGIAAGDSRDQDSLVGLDQIGRAVQPRQVFRGGGGGQLHFHRRARTRPATFHFTMVLYFRN